jgi:hypothetical protein
MLENNVSIKLTPEEFDKISQALEVINSTLKPHLVQLSPEQRRQLPKMSDKTTPFVEKALEMAENHPEFAPSTMVVGELKVDFDSVKTLGKIQKPMEKLFNSLSDTILVAGSEAYIASLAYYNTVKTAAEGDSARAKEIYEELSQRF